MKDKEELLHEHMHLQMGLALEEKKKELAKLVEAHKSADRWFFGTEIPATIATGAGYVYALLFIQGTEGILLSIPLLWATLNQISRLKSRWESRKSAMKMVDAFMELEIPIHDEPEEAPVDEKLKN